MCISSRADGRTRVAVLGAGSWGTAVAIVAAAGGPVRLWCRDPLSASTIAESRDSDRLLGHRLPDAIEVSSSLARVLDGAAVVVCAVPSDAARAVLRAAGPFVEEGAAIVSLTKSFEPDTGRRITTIVQELLPSRPVGMLTGPNLAHEVAMGHPTYAVMAMASIARARVLASRLTAPGFDVSPSDDVVGCEVAGAVKNVVSVAAGMVDAADGASAGLAQVVTTGMAEMTALGIAMGARHETLLGLAGFGDLVLTASSEASRNLAFGRDVVRRGLDAAVAAAPATLEGLHAAAPAADLARRHAVEAPLLAAVAAVVTGAAPSSSLLERFGLARPVRFTALDTGG
jgi:glycerol-3-phosphate dehydrogenase (NAD(P)+)